MKLLILSYLVSVGCLVGVSYLPHLRKCYVVMKTITSFHFLVCAYLTMKDEMIWSWMLAFVFCFAGDVILGLDEKKEQSFCFLAGLSSFVFAHVLFIFTLHTILPLHPQQFFFPLVMCGVACFLISRPSFHIEGKKLAILVYSIIITLLFVKGIEMYHFDSQYLHVMLGTLLFLLSDFILLFMYFYYKKVKVLKGLNLITYYSAVILLAITILP